MIFWRTCSLIGQLYDTITLIMVKLEEISAISTGSPIQLYPIEVPEAQGNANLLGLLSHVYFGRQKQDLQGLKC